MGILGGDAQANGQVTSSINFNPVIQFGKSLSSTAEQRAIQTPKSSQSTSASASIPLITAGTGGKAMGALGALGQTAGAFLGAKYANTGQAGAIQKNSKIDAKKIFDSSNSKKMLAVGLAGLGGYMLIKDKKKKSKK